MTDPVAQIEVEHEIMRLHRLAEDVTSALAERSRVAAETRTRHKVGFARAFLLASGSVGAREAQATVDTADDLLAREVAEAREKAAQEAGRNYRAQLDALRSINANLRYSVTHATGEGS